MDKNEPIIEDPYRTHRRVTPQKPERRIGGSARASRSTPPTEQSESTLPKESRNDRFNGNPLDHPQANPAVEDDADVIRPFRPSSRPVVDLPPMQNSNGISRSPRASFLDLPNAPAEASEPRRVRWNETTASPESLDRPHTATNDAPRNSASPATARQTVDNTPLRPAPVSATPAAPKLPPAEARTTEPATVIPKPLAAGPRTPLPEVTDPRATHRFGEPPRRLRNRGTETSSGDRPAANTSASEPIGRNLPPLQDRPSETSIDGGRNLPPLREKSATDGGWNLPPLADRPSSVAIFRAETPKPEPQEPVAAVLSGPVKAEALAATSSAPEAIKPEALTPDLLVSDPVRQVVSQPETGPLAAMPAFAVDETPATTAPPREQLVRRRTQPTTRPRPAAEDHKSGTTTRSAITIGVLSFLLLAYAFNIGNLQTGADHLLAGLNTSAQAGGNAAVPILSKIIPWLLLIPVLVLFYAIMVTLARAIGLSRKEAVSKARESQKRPLDEFKKAADREGVRNRYAYQGYLLLQPFVPVGEVLQIDHTLEAHLGMTPNQVREVHLNLLRATERQFDTHGKLPYCNTVVELLLAAQQAPRRARAPLPPVYEPGDPKQANRRR